MAENNAPADADGYYGDDDLEDSDLDLSFLDEEEESNKNS